MESVMQGDNAKTINPEPKAQRASRQRARVEHACAMLDIQLDKARQGTHATRVEALRGMLKTLLLTLPYEASRDKKVTLTTALLESAYNDADEFYDMPNVDMDVDGDLVSIHGNFSFRKLAKRMQW